MPPNFVDLIADVKVSLKVSKVSQSIKYLCKNDEMKNLEQDEY